MFYKFYKHCSILLIFGLAIYGSIYAYDLLKYNPKACKTEDNCQKLSSNCKCFSSVKCKFRKKNKNDRPIYIANDPEKKYCYCNQLDKDEYKANCVLE